jgi:glutamine synthetase
MGAHDDSHSRPPRCKTKLEHPARLCHEVIPAMAAVCKAGDTLEGMVADDLWPMATYQEMLFIL